jgi:hypothetical protein
MNTAMKDRGGFERFSLLGGPLYRLGCRFGLVRGGTNTTAIGLALGGGLWTVPIQTCSFHGFLLGMNSRPVSLPVDAVARADHDWLT